MNTWEQWIYLKYNCAHPIREIVDNDNVKCMFCGEQWEETK